jgi:hypothetical protein
MVALGIHSLEDTDAVKTTWALEGMALTRVR